MAAQHLPRYLGGLAVDKRRTRSNKREKKEHYANREVTTDVTRVWYGVTDSDILSILASIRQFSPFCNFLETA